MRPSSELISAPEKHFRPDVANISADFGELITDIRPGVREPPDIRADVVKLIADIRADVWNTAPTSGLISAPCKNIRPEAADIRPDISSKKKHIRPDVADVRADVGELIADIRANRS